MNGSMLGGGGGTKQTAILFAVVGNVSVAADVAPSFIAFRMMTIAKVKLIVKTAPVGAAIIVDVNKNGTTIFTTQANRPTIADGATTGNSVAPDVTGLAEDDVVTVDVDQIGVGTVGADLTVEVVAG